MKKTILSLIFLAGLALFSNAFGQATPPSSPAASSVFTDDKSRESYALGMYLGQSIKKTGVDLNMNLVKQGISDAQSGNTLMSQQEMSSSFTAFRQAAAMSQKKMQMEEGEKNKQAGQAFLDANKAKPGVITLPDGLQYKVITQGSGAIPSATDTVTVNYRGTSIDGAEFDSSFKRGQPATFPVTGVIHGWTEALEKMPVGSKWELYIPSDLAYGPMGRPPVIGPDQALVFEIDLISTQPAPAPAPRQPLTSDIIRVPSAEEMKNGAKVETIKASDLQKMQQGATNQ